MNNKSICEMKSLVSYDEHGVYDLEAFPSFDVLLKSVAGGLFDVNSNGNGACYNTYNELCVNTNACVDNVACFSNAVCVT